MGRRFVAMGVALALAVTVLGGPVLAASDGLGGAAPQSTSSKLGWGMASAATNLGYIPAKMLYALGGGLVGLLGWGFTAGDNNVLYGILDPAFGGTWAVSPEMLRDGDNHPIMFSGPSYDPRS